MIPIEAGGGGAETTVGQVGGIPFIQVVFATLPFHTVAFRQEFIALSDACILDATQLIDAEPAGGCLTEADFIHPANDLQAQFVIQGELCLIQQAIGTGSAGLAGGVDAYTCLANLD